MDPNQELEEKLSKVSISRVMSVFKHRKKQAANDAQLLM